MYSFSNLCRTCGSEESESNPLQGIDKFHEIVGFFTKVKKSFTSNLCEECLVTLNIIQKFADQCAVADLFFSNLLKSQEDANIEQLRKDKLSNESFRQKASVDSLNSNSVNEAKKGSESFLEMVYTEVLETSPRTRSLSLRQKQSVVTTPRSIIQTKKIICDLCDKHFKLKMGLVKHMQSIHLPKISKTPRNSAKSLNKLSMHVDSVHKDQDYSCTQCEKSFLSKKTLKNHEKKHTEIRKYDCTTCQKSFSIASSLKSHLDTHSDTSYICPECGLKLNTKRTLRQHMLNHSDFKPFKCNICGKEFKRSKSFKAHLMIHSDLRHYSCMWCDKTFKSGANFRKHKKEVHPIELAKYDASGVKVGVVLPKLEQLIGL